MTRSNSKQRNCIVCSAKLAKNQSKYCSNACYKAFYQHKASLHRTTQLQGVLCSGPDCDNPLTGSKQKYCSNTCRVNHYNILRQKENRKCLGKPAIMQKYQKWRTCLRCPEQKLFLSEGPWNRKCPTCAAKEKYIRQPKKISSSITQKEENKRAKKKKNA